MAYQAIDKYGITGNMQTAALVGMNGSVGESARYATNWMSRQTTSVTPWPSRITTPAWP